MSKRVNEAFNNHIPFLRRPFPQNDGSLGKWVIAQMPEALAADGRRLLSASTVAQLCDGHAIAEQCISIVASGQRASIKDGPLADFIAIQDDGGDTGRRPRGLDDKRGGGRGGGNDKRTARSAGRGAWLRMRMRIIMRMRIRIRDRMDVLAQSSATLLPSASGCEWGGMLVGTLVSPPGMCGCMLSV